LGDGNHKDNFAWKYAEEHGLLYNGWASPPCTTKWHYFQNGVSVCDHWTHFGRSPKGNDLDWIPKETIMPLCKICLRKHSELQIQKR
jgi:hypothetical protein